MIYFFSCLTKKSCSLFKFSLSLPPSLLPPLSLRSGRGRNRRVRSRLRRGLLLIRHQRPPEHVYARRRHSQRSNSPRRRAGAAEPHPKGRPRGRSSRRAVPRVVLASPELLDGAVDGGEDGADEGKGDGGGGGSAACLFFVFFVLLRSRSIFFSTMSSLFSFFFVTSLAVFPSPPN